MLSAELGYDELIGAVKLNSRWRFFAGTPAEWTLDYAAYDPTYNAEKTTAYVFRNGLLRVDEANAAEFCEAMKEHELSLADIKILTNERGPEQAALTVVVNFDEKLFVNGFFDLALEEHIPAGWKGVFGNPEDYIPPEIRVAWQSLK